MIELVSEARCIPADALFVAPTADATSTVHEESLSRTGLLGSYRAAVGWGAGRTPGASRDQSFRILSAPAPSAASQAGKR
jgi:hypothetical protein